jgi:hypothetical protein
MQYFIDVENIELTPTFNQLVDAVNTASNGAYAAVSTATPFTLAVSTVDGPSYAVVNLTATLAAAGTVTTPTAANWIAGMSSLQVGQSYVLRVINSSSGNYAWTVAAGSGVTITGTATVAQNTWREFIVTVATATTITMQSIGTGTYS